MVLWTVQPTTVVEELEKEGVYRCNPQKAPCLSDGSFTNAYRWLVKQMYTIIGNSPKGINYPVWAWYITDKKHQRPDMRKSAFRVFEPSCLIELEVPDNEVLLTDYNAWHCVLNNDLNYKANYLDISDEEWWGLAEKEDEYFFSLPENDRIKYLEEKRR